MTSGKDRIKAAYTGKFADRVPFYPIAGVCTAAVSEHKISDYLQNVDCFVESQLSFYNRFKPDVVVMLADLLLEAEAMGTSLIFPEHSLCEVAEHPLADKGALSKLGVPDPTSDGRMPYFLEACSLVSHEISDSAVGSTICGPWAIAGALRGVEALIYDTMDDPEFVHRLMRLTTAVVKEFASAVRETRVGVSLSEAPASCSLISPDIFDEFIKPYFLELVTYFKEKRTGLTIHICGYIDPIMESLSECGFSAISIDAPSSLLRMKEINKGRAVLIGNVATDLFSGGNLAQIEQSVDNCLETMASQSRYILASGCEVPPTTPIETLEGFMAYADQQCRAFVNNG